ncbi:MAG: 23S rRNA (pseudouridine(1915)-N(3))-methyltransferase RlmH [Solirubrobacterales bacterium]
MKTVLITVGRSRPPFAEAEAHYRRLLSRHQPVEVVEVRDPAGLAGRVDERAWLAALDARGSARSSEGWSRWLSERRLEGRPLWIAVGGHEGLGDPLLDRADELISLGPQTMAHQLARVVFLEQLFRAAKILAGEPYHR